MTEISRRQFAVYLVAVVLVVLLGGRALRADAGPGTPGAVPPGGFTAQGEPGTAGAGASGASGALGAGDVELTTETERLLVHVAGAVRRPGVYELPSGARIRDALTQAGGGRARADLDALNLAAKVTDGQQVLVARRGRPGSTGAPTVTAGAAPGAATAAAAGTGKAAAAGGSSTAATVNVNQADVTQLEVLNGVGPAIAAKIVEWRTQNGPFKTVEDLTQVSGIGPKKLEAMRAQVVT
ncbi:MAG: ComEA family DNA-binding protein [Actinomycetota bacterium]|nr:ComEA family DNA-binding protein [Actinomycetota bacterium]